MVAAISIRARHNQTVNQAKIYQQLESLTARVTGVRQTMNKIEESTDVSRGPQHLNRGTGKKYSKLRILRGSEGSVQIELAR